MQYDINEGNFLTFKDDEVPTPVDPDSDIPDNTEETGFKYNNYGSTMYATSEDEPEKYEIEDDSDNDSDDEEYESDDDDEYSDDSEEYEDDFVDL
jgi:hypothetical protein